MKALCILTRYLGRLAEDLAVKWYVPTATGSHVEPGHCLGATAASTVRYTHWPDSAK